MPPLINEMNNALYDVADAYKARIAAGCKNDLAGTVRDEEGYCSYCWSG